MDASQKQNTSFIQPRKRAHEAAAAEGVNKRLRLSKGTDPVVIATHGSTGYMNNASVPIQNAYNGIPAPQQHLGMRLYAPAAPPPFPAGLGQHQSGTHNIVHQPPHTNNNGFRQQISNQQPKLRMADAQPAAPRHFGNRTPQILAGHRPAGGVQGQANNHTASVAPVPGRYQRGVPHTPVVGRPNLQAPVATQRSIPDTPPTGFMPTLQSSVPNLPQQHQFVARNTGPNPPLQGALAPRIEGHVQQQQQQHSPQQELEYWMAKAKEQIRVKRTNVPGISVGPPGNRALLPDDILQVRHRPPKTRYLDYSKFFDIIAKTLRDGLDPPFSVKQKLYGKVIAVSKDILENESRFIDHHRNQGTLQQVLNDCKRSYTLAELDLVPRNDPNARPTDGVNPGPWTSGAHPKQTNSSTVTDNPTPDFAQQVTPSQNQPLPLASSSSTGVQPVANAAAALKVSSTAIKRPSSRESDRPRKVARIEAYPETIDLTSDDSGHRPEPIDLTGDDCDGSVASATQVPPRVVQSFAHTKAMKHYEDFEQKWKQNPLVGLKKPDDQYSVPTSVQDVNNSLIFRKKYAWEAYGQIMKPRFDKANEDTEEPAAEVSANSVAQNASKPNDANRPAWRQRELERRKAQRAVARQAREQAKANEKAEKEKKAADEKAAKQRKAAEKAAEKQAIKNKKAAERAAKTTARRAAKHPVKENSPSNREVESQPTRHVDGVIEFDDEILEAFLASRRNEHPDGEAGQSGSSDTDEEGLLEEEEVSISQTEPPVEDETDEILEAFLASVRNEHSDDKVGQSGSSNTNVEGLLEEEEVFIPRTESSVEDETDEKFGDDSYEAASATTVKRPEDKDVTLDIGRGEEGGEEVTPAIDDGGNSDVDSLFGDPYEDIATPPTTLETITEPANPKSTGSSEVSISEQSGLAGEAEEVDLAEQSGGDDGCVYGNLPSEEDEEEEEEEEDPEVAEKRARIAELEQEIALATKKRDAQTNKPYRRRIQGMIDQWEEQKRDILAQLGRHGG